MGAKGEYSYSKLNNVLQLKLERWQNKHLNTDAQTAATITGMNDKLWTNLILFLFD